MLINLTMGVPTAGLGSWGPLSLGIFFADLVRSNLTMYVFMELVLYIMRGSVILIQTDPTSSLGLFLGPQRSDFDVGHFLLAIFYKNTAKHFLIYQ